MILDPVATAGLVTREVRSGTRDGVPTKIAVARRTYTTEQADLWDAITNAERIPRWFLPVSGDLKVGGRYQLEGNAGGVVDQCTAPEFFAVTWEFGGMTSWLEVRLSPDGDGTRLELVHEAQVDPDMWEQVGKYGPGAVGVGWDLALMGLGNHITSGGSAMTAADAEATAAFPTSPEGQEFIRRAATGWAEAAIADGDEPGPARKAAELTFSFYTGSGEDHSSGS